VFLVVLLVKGAKGLGRTAGLDDHTDASATGLVTASAPTRV